ncbi:MAG: flagellar hook-associated protein FlgK [Rhodocyclaceae bacterium]
MSTGLISIGVSGMQAAQMGLLTAEHNVTNASTPGYNRQRTVQATNIPVLTGAGFVGQGAHVTTVERMYSSVLSTQVVRSQTTVSELDSFYSQIKQIDNMLADTNSGVSPALQDFFKGVQQVASDPASLPARQAMVSSAQALASRFNAIDSRISEMYEGVNSQIVSSVSAINSYSQQIANLNERIVVAESSIGQPANDLLDQREQLVSELNKLVGVKTFRQNDGNYTVYMGTGQQLVVGTVVTTVAALASAADPSRMVIGLESAGATQELPESLISGGSLNGLLRFRSETLDKTSNQLGRVAQSLAQTFNAQHALGQDRQGNIAGSANFQADFFVVNPATPKVIGNSTNSAVATLSAAFDAVGINGTNFSSKVTASDYRVEIIGGQYTLTRLSDNKVWPNATDPTALVPGAAFSPETNGVASEGINITIGAGGMTPGDSFLIQPTREISRNLSVNAAIAGDPNLLAAAAPVLAQIGPTNSGKATVTPGVVSPGYSTAGLPVVFTYDGVNINGSDGSSVVYGSGNTISSSGMSFSISGVPVAGDTFTLSTNTAGVADSRNAVLLGKLQTQNTVSGGTASYQASYAQMVSDVGNKTREIQVTQSAQQSLLEQATAAREGLSGVNLDEEAANILRYQQAYAASAKILEIGSKLFDTLLALR